MDNRLDILRKTSGFQKVIRLTILLLFPCLILNTIVLKSADKKIIAISYFDNNSGESKYDKLSKGLSDMLITDLSKIPLITIVEREKLEKLIKEIQLNQSKYFDKTTAQQLGKGLGAEYILTGSIIAVEPNLRIDARLINVSTGVVTVATMVQGKISDFFDLEAQIAKSLLLKVSTKGDLEKAMMRSNSTIDLDLLLEYSSGLEYYDAGLDKEAEQTMEALLNKTPQFEYSRSWLEKTKVRLNDTNQKRDSLIFRDFVVAIKSLNFKSDQSLSQYEVLLDKLGKDPKKFSLLLKLSKYYITAVESCLCNYQEGTRIGDLYLKSQYYFAKMSYEFRDIPQTIKACQDGMEHSPNGRYYKETENILNFGTQILKTQERWKQESFKVINGINDDFKNMYGYSVDSKNEEILELKRRVYEQDLLKFKLEGNELKNYIDGWIAVVASEVDHDTHTFTEKSISAIIKFREYNPELNKAMANEMCFISEFPYIIRRPLWLKYLEYMKQYASYERYRYFINMFKMDTVLIKANINEHMSDLKQLENTLAEKISQSQVIELEFLETVKTNKVHHFMNLVDLYFRKKQFPEALLLCDKVLTMNNISALNFGDSIPLELWNTSELELTKAQLLYELGYMENAFQYLLTLKNKYINRDDIQDRINILSLKIPS